MNILLFEIACCESTENRVSVIVSHNDCNIGTVGHMATELFVGFFLKVAKFDHAGGDYYAFAGSHHSQYVKSHAGALRIRVECVIYNGYSPRSAFHVQAMFYLFDALDSIFDFVNRHLQF